MWYCTEFWFCTQKEKNMLRGSRVKWKPTRNHNWVRMDGVPGVTDACLGITGSPWKGSVLLPPSWAPIVLLSRKHGPWSSSCKKENWKHQQYTSTQPMPLGLLRTPSEKVFVFIPVLKLETSPNLGLLVSRLCSFMKWRFPFQSYIYGLIMLFSFFLWLLWFFLGSIYLALD